MKCRSSVRRRVLRDKTYWAQKEISTGVMSVLQTRSLALGWRTARMPGPEHFAAEFRYVRLPLFWRNRPKLWFVQLESEFSAYRIRSDDQKYNAVLRHLDEATSDIIADVLEKPPDFDKYEYLKRILIARLTDSEEKQLRTLLLGLELGDKKSSQLLREMKSLAGSRVSDDLLRTLWCQRLPARTQELLLIFDSSSLDKLAECADKIYEHPTTLEVHAAEARMSLAERANDPIRQLTMQVAQLTAQVRRLERPHSGGRRWRDRSRGRSRSRGTAGHHHPFLQTKVPQVCVFIMNGSVTGHISADRRAAGGMQSGRETPTAVRCRSH